MAAGSLAAEPQTSPGTARMMINAFDGTRQLMPPGKQTLVTVRDGWGNQSQFDRPGPSIELEGLTVYDNSGDNYAAIAFCDGY